MFISDEDLQRHAHAVLPNVEKYELCRLQADFHFEKATSTITMTLRLGDDRRVLCFHDVAYERDVLLAAGRKYYIVDLAYRGWEMKIAVGEYYEDGAVLFYAARVEDLTDQLTTRECK